MAPEQSIQPLNVAAATFLVELLLITVLAITSSLFKGNRWPPGRSAHLHPGFPQTEHSAGGPLRRSPTLFVALASFAVLLISDEFYSIWSPIFQGVGINTISAATAIGTVFILDLFLVAYLMFVTGGSRGSPFLSALFTIPALAIFLRLPPSMFITYAVLACVLYLLLLVPAVEQVQSNQWAAAFMNISCLLLSMFTGYITRPVPIDELKALTNLSAHSASSPSSNSTLSKGRVSAP